MFGLDFGTLFWGAVVAVVCWWFVPQPRFMRKMYKRWGIAYWKDRFEL